MPAGSPIPSVPPAANVNVPLLPLPNRLVPNIKVAPLLTVKLTAPLTVLYVQPREVPLPAEQFDDTMRALYEDARGTRLVRIADSRHFIQWDQPARFVSEVDAFMRR